MMCGLELGRGCLTTPCSLAAAAEASVIIDHQLGLLDFVRSDAPTQDRSTNLLSALARDPYDQDVILHHP